MHFPYANGIKCTKNYVDDYTGMCCVHLLKSKSQAFKTFKDFHVWIRYEA